MLASDLLQAAYRMAIANGSDINKKWVRLSNRVAGIAGVNHLYPMQQNSRLDLLLRQLERERLDSLQAPPMNEVDWTLDMQSLLSNAWVLGAYEKIRVLKKRMNDRGEANARVTALAHRFAIVRMPMAKGEIEGMDRKLHKGNPPVLTILGETQAHRYSDDGGYIMPSGFCGETGAVLWWPVDMTAGKTVATCRRDLSDEFLALFD